VFLRRKMLNVWDNLEGYLYAAFSSVPFPSQIIPVDKDFRRV